MVIISAAVLIGCGGAAVQSSANPAPSGVPPPTLDPRQVARGRAVYRGHCASCHGPQAEGAPNWQQPDERGNMPPPPHNDSGHTWRHSDAQLAEIIRNGLRDPFNKTPDLAMPPFKDRLSEEEIQAVIAYVKSLWSPEHRGFQEKLNEKEGAPSPGSRP